MVSFSHFQKLDVSSNQTTEYVFPQLDGRVSLTVSPAAEVNKPFFNALLKRARKSQKNVQAGLINTNTIAQSRDEDRELYALHVIKGWKNVTDDKGKKVEFSMDNLKAFLKALPDDIFDNLRAFCSDLTSFRDQDIIDVETTSKNS